jgi:hypothetical protein
VATCGAAKAGDMRTRPAITAVPTDRNTRTMAIRTAVTTPPGSTAAPKRSGSLTFIITGLTTTRVGDSYMVRPAFSRALADTATEAAMASDGAMDLDIASAPGMGRGSDTNTTAIAEHTLL